MTAQKDRIFFTLDECGQSHLYTFWNELNEEEKANLSTELDLVSFTSLSKSLSSALEASQHAQLVDDRLMCPSPSVIGHALPLREAKSPLYSQYLETGLSVIKSGKVAVLLLAGGQGTRLGCSYPKGMYDIGLPSRRSLFQLQAERLLAVCRKASGQSDKPAFIPWYIMTSEQTQQMTQAYFEKHNFFGYSRQHIVFFEQFSIPVLDFNGKVLMHSRNSLCWSPEGNGGLYRALRERRILEDMATRGVEYVHIYGVDNVLTKMADPHFLGFCISKEAECGAKVVEKTMPEEPIGVVGVVDGKFRVIEYSEISPSTAAQLLPIPSGRLSWNGFPEGAGDPGDAPRLVSPSSPTPRLLYSLGNICNHFMTRGFLERVCSADAEAQLVYHIARKKVPHLDPTTGEMVEPSQPNAYKLEKFIFDVFPLADRFAIWEVCRSEEFSPLKNGPSAEKDCPATCRAAILSLHQKWALQAGAAFQTDNIETNCLEISPLVSLDGENLDCLRGKTLQGINHLESPAGDGEPLVVSA